MTFRLVTTGIVSLRAALLVASLLATPLAFADITVPAAGSLSLGGAMST